MAAISFSRANSAAVRKSIAIAGNIGVGKSTLVEFLSRTYAISPYYEPSEDNPYLPDFYRDMKRWAFHSQVYFLGSKFRIHQELDRSPGLVALDRTIFEDAEIFATALYDMRCIDKRDWATYWKLYQSILQAIRPPDLMIYLRCSMPALRKRIRQRGRSMEASVPLAYLKRLERLYEKWIASYDMSELLILDTDNMDYIHDLVHRLDIMQKIEAMLPPQIGRPGC